MPPHFYQDVPHFLKNNFLGRWLERSGAVALPPRSPDLNSLNFFFAHSIEELQQRTEVAADVILDQFLTFALSKA